MNFDNKHLTGEAEISSSLYSNKKYFTIEYNLFSILITTANSRMDKFFGIGTFKFEGILENGESISCEEIVLSKSTKERITFIPLKSIVIGNSSQFNTISVPLIGMYLGNIDCELHGFSIKVVEPEECTSKQLFCAQYGNIIEGARLSVTSTNPDMYKVDIEICDEICTIISLITGNMIRMTHFSFSNEKGLTQEHLRMIGISSTRGKGCLDLRYIKETFETLFSNYHLWKKEDKKHFKHVLEYINDSAGNYLENSILNISQAWEISADYWGVEKVTLSSSLDDLKAKLKEAIKSWKETDSEYDLDMISNRVLGALNWEKNLNKLEKLAIENNVSADLLQIDFSKLVKLRNGVVHAGVFRKKGEEYENFNLLNSSILGLQVLLLTKLGYEGNVVTYLGAFPKLVNIRTFLIS